MTFVTQQDALVDPSNTALVDQNGNQLIVSMNVFVAPPPPPTFTPPVRDWWDMDEWGRITPGYCYRR